MGRRRLSHHQVQRIRDAQERRRRRALEQAARHGEAALAGAPGAEEPGLVVANYGAHLVVEDARGALHRCAVRQHLGGLACGDRVAWQPTGEAEGVVVARGERRSVLARPDAGDRPRPVAANLDQVVVVVAPQPEPNPFLVDRYLVAIAATGAEALLLANKMDLPDGPSRRVLEACLATYARVGYPLLHASTRTAHGLDALRQRLRERTSLLVGQSGVGKSSLVKALLPDRAIRIQALSAATGLGTHTTTTATLYHLPGGGDLIDSPGVQGFELGVIDPDTLVRGFPEFAPHLGHCRFSDCRHTVEPGCALRAAVDRGEIHPRRLESFHRIADPAP